MVPCETASPDVAETSSLTHDSCRTVMLPFKSEMVVKMDLHVQNPGGIDKPKGFFRVHNRGQNTHGLEKS